MSGCIGEKIQICTSGYQELLKSGRIVKRTDVFCLYITACQIVAQKGKLSIRLAKQPGNFQDLVLSERERGFSMESDQELIELANKGDSDAFEALYRRYRDWVYRLAWRFTGNRADALDALQETFTYLLGKFPGFELTASMTTFLYPVVRHVCFTICNKRNRFTSEEQIIDELAAPKSEESEHYRSELAAVLIVLPDEQREVLLMRFVDDLSLQEIAAALDIPLGTVKSRLHNALQVLRNDRRTRDYFLE